MPDTHLEKHAFSEKKLSIFGASKESSNELHTSFIF